MIVLMPAGMHGRIRRPDQRRWLASGQIDVQAPPGDALARVLGACDLPPPGDGRGALRLWGQTGQRPAGWVAAADPVHLEAQLDHLRLYALPEDALSAADLAAVCRDLQETLGDDAGYTFSSNGNCAYLFTDTPIATAALPPHSIDGARPEDHLPAGDGASAHDRLVGEIQMALHDHAVNRRLAGEGRRTVNALWLWGGGHAPPARRLALPDLYAADPMLRGYWHGAGGTVLPCSERLADCLGSVPRAVVAVARGAANGERESAMEADLDELRELLGRGDITRLTLLFSDGLTVKLGRYSRWRIWRRTPPMLCERVEHD